MNIVIMIIKKQNTIIMELKEKGYLRLKPIKGKRREMNIIISQEGKIYANNVLKDIYEYEKYTFNYLDFNVKEFIKNFTTIEKLLKNAKQ